MNQEIWYRRYREGREKYLLVQQMNFRTRVKPKDTIEFPNDFSLIKLTNAGNLTLEKGYTWNGATLIPDSEVTMRATLAHDALYLLMRRGLLERAWRKEVDRLFRKICFDDKMPAPFAHALYASLRAVGWLRAR